MSVRAGDSSRRSEKSNRLLVVVVEYFCYYYHHYYHYYYYYYYIIIIIIIVNIIIIIIIHFYNKMVEINGVKKHDRYENKLVEQFACNINVKVLRTRQTGEHNSLPVHRSVIMILIGIKNKSNTLIT